jgi:hypothetical protein
MSLISRWLRSRVADPNEADLERRLLVLLGAGIVLALVYVWLNLMVQDLGYRVENTAKLIEKLDLEHAELAAEMSYETAPERLRRHAEVLFDLHVPSAGQVMTIDAKP